MRAAESRRLNGGGGGGGSTSSTFFNEIVKARAHDAWEKFAWHWNCVRAFCLMERDK